MLTRHTKVYTSSGSVV